METDADTLERIQVVTASWLATMEANKYTESVMADITNLQVEATILLSSLPEYSYEEPDPEITVLDNLPSKIEAIKNTFVEMRPIMERLTATSKTLKRKASDCIEHDSPTKQPSTDEAAAQGSQSVVVSATSALSTAAEADYNIGQESTSGPSEFGTCSQPGK
jgi:hypothetical protein